MHPVGEVREARPVGSLRPERQYRDDAASRTRLGERRVIVSEQYRWFVGIDWATERHEVCIVDGGGQVVDRRSIEHSGAGIAQLIGYLKELRFFWDCAPKKWPYGPQKSEVEKARSRIETAVLL